MVTMLLKVKVIGAPDYWEEQGKIYLEHQSTIKPPIRFESSTNNTWNIEIRLKDGLWIGPNVGRNSDGRRFIYFAWKSEFGQRFRRIKLYQDQVVGEEVTISGTLPKDGSPACSTAIII